MLSVDDLLALAKGRTGRLVDHLNASILMHETNATAVYSPLLSDQIPTSHAAQAFNQFQRTMHLFATLRLCAL